MGGTSLREAQDKKGLQETYFAPGLVSEFADAALHPEGANIVLHQLNQGDPAVIALLLPVLEEDNRGRRQFRRPDGVLLEVNPDCHFTATVRNSDAWSFGLSPAIVNRMRVKAMAPQTQEQRTERLVAVATKMDPRLAVYAKLCIRFEAGFIQLVADSQIAVTSRSSLAVPTFERLVDWLELGRKAIEKNDQLRAAGQSAPALEQAVKEAFVAGAAAEYDVAKAYNDKGAEVDRYLLNQLATALFDGNEELIKKSLKGKRVPPAAG
jgi:hypothetical protein